MLGYLIAGMSLEEILDDFPELEEADFKSIFTYCQMLVRQADNR